MRPSTRPPGMPPITTPLFFIPCQAHLGCERLPLVLTHDTIPVRDVHLTVLYPTEIAQAHIFPPIPLLRG